MNLLGSRLSSPRNAVVVLAYLDHLWDPLCVRRSPFVLFACGRPFASFQVRATAPLAPSLPPSLPAQSFRGQELPRSNGVFFIFELGFVRLYTSIANMGPLRMDRHLAFLRAITT